MKNLKKILLALVLVALIASSIVTVAIAEASYTGLVSEAKLLYKTAVSVGKTADSKVEPLKTLYQYLLTVNPDDEGYDEVVEDYNQMTFKVMKSLYAKVEEATTLKAKSEAIAAIHTYKKTAPVIGDDYREIFFSEGFVCVAEGCGKYRDFTEDEYFNGITDTLSCPGTCTPDKQKLEYAKDSEHSTCYFDFEKDLSLDSLSVSNALVSQIYALSAKTEDNTANYFEVIQARKALNEYLDSIVKLDYKAPESALYTGDVAAAAALIKNVSESSSLEQLKTALAATYDYLVKNPVISTTDDYYSFMKKYIALGDTLVAKLTEEVNSAATVEEKAEILADFYTYLEDSQISEKVVNGFNSLRASLIKQYSAVGESTDGLVIIEASVPAVSYKSGFDTFLEKLTAAEALSGEELGAAVEELYAIVSEGAFDPATAGYRAAIKRYVALCTNYVKFAFIDKIDSTSDLSVKLDTVEKFLIYIYETPLCQEVTDSYSKTLSALTAQCEALKAVVSATRIPDYKAPAKDKVTSSEFVLFDMLERLDARCAAVESADAASKASALEAMKKSLAELHSYIMANGIDSEAEYYGEFVAKYNELRSSAFSVLLNSALDAGDGKLAALTELSKYLSETPITFEAINSFNAIVADIDAGLRVGHASLTANDYKEKIFAEGASDAQVIAIGLELAKLVKNGYDITDPSYTDFVALCETSFERVATSLNEGLLDDMTNASAKEYSAVIKRYQGYLDSMYYDSCVKMLQSAVSVMNSSITEIIGSLSSDSVYKDKYTYFLESVNAFDAAKTTAERFAAFEALYDLFNNEFFTDEFVNGSSYSIVSAEYARVLLKMENELIGILGASSVPEETVENIETVYGYISGLLFSDNIKKVYNEACEAAKTLDFSAAAEAIAASCTNFTYETPEGWSSRVARIKLALEMAGTKGEVNEPFIVAYNILSGFVNDTESGKEYGNAVIDFGVQGFATVLELFNETKLGIVNANLKKIANANSYDEKALALVELRAFIEEYPFSLALVECYTEMCGELSASYKNELSDLFGKFETLLKVYENHLASCPVDVSCLDELDAAKYNTGVKISEALRIVALEGMIEEYDSITGTLALVYKNQLVNRINAYVGDGQISNVSEANHVSAMVEFLFEEFITEFSEELKSMDPSTAERQINSIGSYIVFAKFPYSLVNIYNSVFGTSFSAEYAGAATGKGDISVLLSALDKIDFTSSLDTLEKIEAIVKYVNENEFSNDSMSDAINDKIAELKTRAKNETEAQMNKLDSLAKPSEYAYSVLFNVDHENGKHFASIAGTSGDPGYSKTIVKEGNNSYAKYYSSSGSSYNHVSISDSSKGLVFEMRIMPTDEKFDMNMYFYSSTTGKKQQVRIFWIQDCTLMYTQGTAGSDKTEFENYRSGVDAPIKFTPGEWTHIAVAYDFATGQMEMYVDYVSLGKKAICHVNGSTLKYDPDYYNSARIVGTSADNTICYDDVKIYQGTSFRLVDKQLSSEQWFNTYVASMLDESFSSTARAAAYYSAKELYNAVGSAADADKALFDAFDPTFIIAEANEFYLKEIESRAENIKLDSITTKTVKEVKASIESIEEYIEENRQYIPTSSDRFMAIGDLLIDAKAKTEWVGNLSIAVDHLGRFHRATTSASQLRHYNLFKEYYDICRLSDPDTMDTASADPVCTAFMEKAIETASVEELLGANASFSDYCAKYIDYIMLAQNNYENSLKILDCIEFIKLIEKDESEFESIEAYYEALVKAASEEYDYVETYLSIIRLIERAESYDSTVSGIAVALEIFEILDEEFDKILKAEQFGVIKERLERYEKTTSYIEKAGICTFLENYISANNVDLSGAEGVQYLYALEIYKSEIEVYKSDFEAVLAANTELFIGLVQKMTTYTTYSELKPLYDEAIENYYYSMNVDSERAQDAIAKFSVYQDMILEWEQNSALFVGYVGEIKTQMRQAHRFRLLVRCADHVDKVDIGIAGVSKAIEKYNAELAKYNESIAPARSEVSEIGSIVCSLRTESVPAPVLAIVKKYMDN